MNPPPTLQLFVLLFLSSSANSAKILLFVPSVCRSNVLFFAKVANLLAASGNDVTFYAPDYSIPAVRLAKEIVLPPVHYIDVKSIDDRAAWDEMEAGDAAVFDADLSLGTGEGVAFFKLMADLMGESCQVQVKNTKLMAKLKAEKFDVAFAHMYDLCPFGIIHMLGIPSTIWMSSSVLTEIMSYTSGIPSPPSFVPGVMSAYTDNMTLHDRTMNFLGAAIFVPYFLKLQNAQTQLFRELVDPNFPDLLSLARDQSQLLFVNSVELLDFPRPLMHKVIYIGGIGMKNPKALDAEWEKVMNARKDGTILVSFGSVAPAHAMPVEWKQAICGLARLYPTYQFIWKYEKEDIKRGEIPGVTVPDNLHVSPWVPQTDLLGHKNLKAFITHGGYNSLLETAYAGKPIVAVALFGDQYRNARAAERNGFGMLFDKTTMSAETLGVAIGKVLNEKSYTTSARKMARMLKMKPTNSEELVVKWTEFLAEFKTLPNMDPISKHMTTAEYYSLDSIAIISSIMATVLIVIFFVLKMCVCWLCCRGRHGTKTKRE